MAELKRPRLIGPSWSAGSDMEAKHPSDVKATFQRGGEGNICTHTSSHDINSLTINQRPASICEKFLEEEQLCVHAVTTRSAACVQKS